jgi:mono/diheme cytochrome c family protein
VKCHGKDGTRGPARGLIPEIPDFAAAAWQARQSEAQLLASILDGKGQDMPPFRGKINKDQARDLALVHALAPATGKPGPKKRQGPASPSDFEKEFRRLQEKMDKLQKQRHQAAEVAPDRKPSKPSRSPPRSADPPDPSESPPHAASRRSAQAPTGTFADPELFRRHCRKCHGADDTGSRVRGRQPQIPNFTDASWQARRSGLTRSHPGAHS